MDDLPLYGAQAPAGADSRPIGFRLTAAPSPYMSVRMEYLVNEAFSMPYNAVAYFISQQLHDAFPERMLVEGSDWNFDLEAYAKAGHCVITARPSPYPQWVTEWDEADGDLGSTTVRADQAWFDVVWQDARLEVLAMRWCEGRSRPLHVFILADDRAVATGFLQSVCAWSATPRDRVLVYDGDEWGKDAKLFAALATADFDSLVLAGDLKEQLRTDAGTFFAARETYERYRIPWKRGILLYGPPGNGKTHALKALIRELSVPCLYVKSFRYSCGPDELSIQEVFGQARKSAPCVLVLEDLDALITKRNRSHFLNELDGFARNEGILTLATSNHPKRLDPAIVARPSRFDRKIPFDLPERPERWRYVTRWNAGLEAPMAASNATLAGVADNTDGFSFAYLKELCTAALMRWMSTPCDGAMDDILPVQVTLLCSQMRNSGKKQRKKDTPAPESVGSASGGR